MTTDGWEQRLADLGQAREESIDLTPGVVWTDAQLSIVRDLAARSAQAQAAVKRVEALATELDIEARGRWLRVLDARTADERDAEFGERGAGDALHDAAIRIRRAVDGCPT